MINDFEFLRIVAILRGHSQNLVSLVKPQVFYICWKKSFCKFSIELYNKRTLNPFPKSYFVVIIILQWLPLVKKI